MVISALWPNDYVNSNADKYAWCWSRRRLLFLKAFLINCNSPDDIKWWENNHTSCHEDHCSLIRLPQRTPRPLLEAVINKELLPSPSLYTVYFTLYTLTGTTLDLRIFGLYLMFFHSVLLTTWQGGRERAEQLEQQYCWAACLISPPYYRLAQRDIRLSPFHRLTTKPEHVHAVKTKSRGARLSSRTVAQTVCSQCHHCIVV